MGELVAEMRLPELLGLLLPFSRTLEAEAALVTESNRPVELLLLGDVESIGLVEAVVTEVGDALLGPPEAALEGVELGGGLGPTPVLLTDDDAEVEEGVVDAVATVKRLGLPTLVLSTEDDAEVEEGVADAVAIVKGLGLPTPVLLVDDDAKVEEGVADAVATVEGSVGIEVAAVALGVREARKASPLEVGEEDPLTEPLGGDCEVLMDGESVITELADAVDDEDTEGALEGLGEEEPHSHICDALQGTL